MCALASAACGPSPGDQGSAEDESGESTSTGGSASDVGDGAPDSTEGGATSGRESETSTTDGESSSDESSSTTDPVFTCDCAPNEVCFEIGVDHCFPDQVPETHCIETPAACEGIEPTCEGECGWEICGGPYCGGPGKFLCHYESPGFVCSTNGGQGCNICTQSCSGNDKCVSFDGAGSDEYTTTLCAATKPPTVGVGEACVVEHGNGHDNCESGSMCVADPPSATTGVCRAACVGNPWNASCTDPAMQCVLDGWWFAWCFPI